MSSMPPDAATTARIGKLLEEVLDRECPDPADQVFITAHVFASCAFALGAPLELAATLLRTRYAHAQKVLGNAPKDLQDRWLGARRDKP